MHSNWLSQRTRVIQGVSYLGFGMLSLAQEQAHLAKAELDIADGQRRIAAQELRIQAMRHKGHDTRRAEELLATLQDTLVQWHAHRDEILRTILRLEAS